MNAIAPSRVSDVFAEALQADRDTFNAMFAQYRVSGQEIDSAQFLDHLVVSVDPLVTRVNEVLPERVRLVVRELYAASLSLFASSLLGPNAKVPEVADVYDRLLTIIPEHLARDPARVVASCCNAAYNLAAQNGADASRWLNRLIEIAPQCKDVAALLDCGQILAWQSGMAQYRVGALTTARRLPVDLNCRLMELPDGTEDEQVTQIFDQLENDPWQTPQTLLAASERPTVELGRTVGAFRGFNGVFRRPPTVCVSEVGLHVSDGDGHWDLIADAYGSMLHRTNARKPVNPADGSPTIFADGRVNWGDDQARFPMLAKSSSRAFDGSTLAVTIPTSHHIYLLARI